MLDRGAGARRAATAASPACTPEDYRRGVWVLAAFALMRLLTAQLVREIHCRNVDAGPAEPPLR